MWEHYHLVALQVSLSMEKYSLLVLQDVHLCLIKVGGVVCVAIDVTQLLPGSCGILAKADRSSNVVHTLLMCESVDEVTRLLSSVIYIPQKF